MSETSTPVQGGIIDTTALSNAQIREIDFVESFSESVKKLVEALGVTRKIAKTAGSVLKTYKATGELLSGEVDEGEVIPLSKYTVEPASYQEIVLKKWRKATTAEAITEFGYNQAVAMTTERMLKDVQKEIRGDFFDFLASAGEEGGAGTKVSGTGLQGALAKAWGNLQVLFEDDEIESVYFVNPLAIADYLASAQITVQNAFGMQYVENFMGLGTVILNSSVPASKVYATAKNNIVLYYIAVNGADLGSAFSFTSDETGYIGIHSEADYSNLTHADTVMNGMVLFAERMDGIVVSTIA